MVKPLFHFLLTVHKWLFWRSLMYYGRWWEVHAFWFHRTAGISSGSGGRRNARSDRLVLSAQRFVPQYAFSALFLRPFIPLVSMKNNHSVLNRISFLLYCSSQTMVSCCCRSLQPKQYRTPPSFVFSFIFVAHSRRLTEAFWQIHSVHVRMFSPKTTAMSMAHCPCSTCVKHSFQNGISVLKWTVCISSAVSCKKCKMITLEVCVFQFFEEKTSQSWSSKSPLSTVKKAQSSIRQKMSTITFCRAWWAIHAF